MMGFRDRSRTRRHMQPGRRQGWRAEYRVLRRFGLKPVEASLQDVEIHLQANQHARSSILVLGLVRECGLMLHALGRLHMQTHSFDGPRGRFSADDHHAIALRSRCAKVARRVTAEVLLLLRVGLFAQLQLREAAGGDTREALFELAGVGSIACVIETLADDELMAWIREGTFVREIAAGTEG